MKKYLLKLASALVIALVGSSAFADMIPDQSQTNWNYQARVYNLQSECQTFTCGISGKLSEVDIHLTSGNGTYDQSAPITVNIVGVTGGDNHPDTNNVLWTQYFSGGLATGWNTIDTSSGAPTLTAGTMYGILLESIDSSSSSPNDAWDYTTNAIDQYPAGILWQTYQGVWRQQTISGNSVSNPDAAFKTFIIVPVFKLSDLSVRTNQFGFTIIGISNLVVVVEACTNLGNPVWSPVGTNTLTDGSSYFSDSDRTNYPNRFYRARWP
jgi:hypothetical protein